MEEALKMLIGALKLACTPGLSSVIMGFITSTPGFIFLLFTLLFVGVITFLVVVGNRKRKQNPRRGES